MHTLSNFFISILNKKQIKNFEKVVAIARCFCYYIFKEQKRLRSILKRLLDGITGYGAEIIRFLSKNSGRKAPVCAKRFIFLTVVCTERRILDAFFAAIAKA